MHHRVRQVEGSVRSDPHGCQHTGHGLRVRDACRAHLPKCFRESRLRCCTGVNRVHGRRRIPSAAAPPRAPPGDEITGAGVTRCGVSEHRSLPGNCGHVTTSAGKSFVFAIRGHQRILPTRVLFAEDESQTCFRPPGAVGDGECTQRPRRRESPLHPCRRLYRPPVAGIIRLDNSWARDPVGSRKTTVRPGNLAHWTRERHSAAAGGES